LPHNIKSFELRAHDCESIVNLGNLPLEAVEGLVLLDNVVEIGGLHEVVAAHNLNLQQLRADIEQAALCLRLVKEDLAQTDLLISAEDERQVLLPIYCV
jgi:hypothetical protein